MARFGDLEAAIMDVVWAADAPVRVREVADRLNQDRPLAFNTVQTVMEILFRKGWLARSRDGRAYLYVAGRTRDEYAAGLLAEALSAAGSQPSEYRACDPAPARRGRTRRRGAMAVARSLAAAGPPSRDRRLAGLLTVGRGVRVPGWAGRGHPVRPAVCRPGHGARLH